MIFLDTHVVVWLYAGYLEKLSKAVIEKIENNELFVSQLVRLELQYLFEIGRITVEPEVLLKSLNQSIGLKISQMLARHPRYISPWDIHVQRFIPLGRLNWCPGTSCVRLNSAQKLLR